MFIGVTGQIGSGKSTVAELLAERGAAIVDADEVGRAVTGSATVLSKLVKIWGEDIRTKGGKLRPSVLAARVFSDDSGEQLLLFNEIIRAPLGKAIRGALSQARKASDVVVLDAALLLDWDTHKDMDLVVLVSATREVRLKRLVSRGMSKDDALARMGRQSSLKAYREICDVVISNNTSITELRRCADRLWRKRILPQL